MYKVIFDCNVYDKLYHCPDLQGKISRLISENKLMVMVTSTIRRELEISPFKGVPEWFHTEIIGDSVFLSEYSLTDVDRVGEGDIYDVHKGHSKNFRDAIIADTAHTDADIFVSEDNRCRQRFKKISDSCKSMSFSEFENWLNNRKM
ncbi:MAG: hypothetical protein Q7T53_01495 [Deltaproteobacteria bacterium]|nr:hypothetical protein [Deltaproteobacteria bacterium]